MEAYLGQIIIFAGPYTPENWAVCDGSTLSIQQYPALYALLGTTFGGNGVADFALPDLRGRLPVGVGQGTGLSAYTMAAKAGAETVTLTAAQTPTHTHTLTASAAAATTDSPAGNILATVPAGHVYYLDVPAVLPSGVTVTAATHSTNTVTSANGQTSGAAASHGNVMLSLALNYLICTTGLFPQS